MKLSPKKSNLAALRQAARRIDELHRRIGLFEKVPLEKKMFVGHWRYMVVRADVLRSSIGRQVQQVVDQCNHWVLGRKKASDSYRCSTEVKAGPNITTHIGEQYLRPLNAKQWEKANFPEHVQRKWFETVTTFIRAGTKNIPQIKYFPRIPRHMLEYGYKRAYIEEVTSPKPDVESELARLYQFMREHNGWVKLGQRNRDEWDLSLTKKRKLQHLASKEAEFEAQQSKK